LNACEIVLPPSKELHWRVYPIGDLHCDLKLFNEEKFGRYVAKIAADPHAVWVSVGDYLDGTTPDHKYFNPQVIADEILLNMDKYVNRVYERLLKLFKPLQAKPGIMLEGNKEKRGGLKWSGFVPALARELGAEYLGYEGLARILVRVAGRNSVTTLHVQHGSGGGRKPGAKINTFQDTTLATADADIYIRGHTEDAMTRILPIYSINHKGKPALVRNLKAWVTAAGFYGNRIQGINHYNAEKMMPSVDEGTFFLEIWDVQNGGERKRSIQRHEFI